MKKIMLVAILLATVGAINSSDESRKSPTFTNSVEQRTALKVTTSDDGVVKKATCKDMVKDVVTSPVIIAEVALIALMFKNQKKVCCPLAPTAQNPAAAVGCGLGAWKMWQSTNQYVKYSAVLPASAAVWFALKK